MAGAGRGFGRVCGFDTGIPKRGAACVSRIIREPAGIFPVFRAFGESPPELNPVGSRTVEAGQPLTISVTASDGDEDELSFSATGSGD